MQPKGEKDRTIMVYVDSYHKHVPTGRFHIASSPETKPFESLSHLLLQINESLDREKYPQSYMELRRFHDPQTNEVTGSTAVTHQMGKVATFAIRILFRQNASWQGSVVWVDGKQEECFRSVLELIVLIDNALGYT